MRRHKRIKHETLRRKTCLGVLKNVRGPRKVYKGSCLRVDCEVWVGLQQVHVIRRNSYQAAGAA